MRAGEPAAWVRSVAGGRAPAIVLAATALGAALRFLTLDAKGLWQDEAGTIEVIDNGFGDIFPALAETQRLPPLYYVLAWGWTALFGDGEVGVRSLSALAGTATIPIAYLAARELVSTRAGLFAAALVAANPLLIWYSQEARAYALVILLSAVALLFFGRALNGGRARDVALWALASALALGTHYFAGFLFVAEAAWLLSVPRTRRATIAASLTVGALAAGLIPLAIEQQARVQDDFITDVSLASRIVQVPGAFLVGLEVPYPERIAAAVVTASLAAVALVLLARRATRRERRGALICASIAGAGIVLPLLLVPLSVDVFLYRNVIVAALPLAIVVGAGFGAARAARLGLAAAGGLVTLFAGLALATAWEDKYGRESWREAAAALGDPERPRAILATPAAPAYEPLGYYLDGARARRSPPPVTEIDVLALRTRPLGDISSNPELPDVRSAPRPPTGFALVGRRSSEDFLLFRYRAQAGRRVQAREVRRLAIRGSPAVLVQR